MKRKYLAILVSLMALLLLIAACSDDDDAETDDTETTATSQSGSRLKTVEDRGKVVCAGRTDLAGFGYLDSAGNNLGFDIDLCRAVAAAIFGNGDALQIVPITASERGPTIQAGEVDILSRNVTWT